MKDPGNRAIRLTLAFTVCLSAVAVDVCLPAIPDAVHYFGAPDRSGALIIAMYLAGYALGQIPTGFAADRYGRLPVFYAGIVVFLLASAATVFAGSMQMLLAARFVQGLAGASGPVLARAMARDITEGRELARLTALLVSALAVAMLVAPVIGSAAILAGGWRATLSVSLIMGLAALFLVHRYLRETITRETAPDTLWSQFAQSARAFFGSAPSVWAAWLIALTFFAYMSIVAGLSQVVVDVYGMPSASVGLVFSGAIIFYLLSAQLGRRALGRVSSLQLMRLGFVGYGLTAIMCACIVVFDWNGFWPFWCTLIPFLMGMGVVYSNATAIALAPLRRLAGFAASILGTLQIVISTIGAAMTGLLYDRSTDSVIAVLFTGSTAALLVFALGSTSPRMMKRISDEA